MTLQKKLILLITSTLLGITVSSHAYAFEDSDARRAILDLRAQLKQNQQARSDLLNQVQNLQQQLTDLRGQVETLNHQLNPNSPSPNGAPIPQVGDPNQQRAYDNALNLFRQGEYTNASKALSAFAQQYPDSPLTPSARFYEGSSRYASKDFKGAISILNNMVRDYPNDNKAGDAMLVIAGSQVELNQIKQAKQTLERVLKFYPNTPAADSAKDRLRYFK